MRTVPRAAEGWCGERRLLGFALVFVTSDTILATSAPSLPATAVPMAAARRLREATRARHDAVERLPLMQALMHGRLDTEGYAALLRRHLAVFAAWEHRHAAWLSALAPVWRYRPRTSALQADLAALQVPLAACNPALSNDLRASDEAACWGMLYVAEGSLLGGRVIARRLRTHQPDLAIALRYFELGGDEPAAWPRFQRLLQNALPDPGALARATAGAGALFDFFHHHLDDRKAA